MGDACTHRESGVIKHTKAFLKLKATLISKPVLKGPLFDRMPFIVTTNSSGQAFSGTLAQQFTTKLLSGKIMTQIHPVAFTSKWISCTEEKYESFLLEFATLKFCMDKFTDIIWGFPIEYNPTARCYTTCY